MKNKKILAAVLSAAMVLSLTACSSGNGENTTPAANDATTPAATDSEATTPAGTEDDEQVFVLEKGITDKMIELSRLNEGNMTRLAKLFDKLKAGEEVTIAYIGGSITQGSSAGDNLCYARLTTNWFEETYPSAKINYVRAGIGATGSYIGVHRVDKDVLANNPDLVFVEFSVNDTTENTERNKESYDSLLRKIWNYQSAPAIVCIGMTQEDGTTFQNYHFEIAKSYDLPFISYREAILHVIQKGYIVWKDISDDNIHPNVEGHAVLSALLTSYLSEAAEKGDSSAAESDFSKAATAATYENATLLRPDNCEPENNGFTKDEGNFGNFMGYWTVRSSSGDYGGASLKFNVEGKNIGILFGKIVGRGGKFEVKVDGESVKTVDCNFPNGWGNYVECVEVARFDEKGTHTVEIIPVNADGGKVINISSIAVS